MIGGFEAYTDIRFQSLGRKATRTKVPRRVDSGQQKEQLVCLLPYCDLSRPLRESIVVRCVLSLVGRLSVSSKVYGTLEEVITLASGTIPSPFNFKRRPRHAICSLPKETCNCRQSRNNILPNHQNNPPLTTHNPPLQPHTNPPLPTRMLPKLSIRKNITYASRRSISLPLQLTQQSLELKCRRLRSQLVACQLPFQAAPPYLPLQNHHLRQFLVIQGVFVLKVLGKTTVVIGVIVHQDPAHFWSMEINSTSCRYLASWIFISWTRQLVPRTLQLCMQSRLLYS